MDYHFDATMVAQYKSNSQKIRIMSETWVAQNIYCPVCGNTYISGSHNNLPVQDFQCDNCGETYELKAKKGKIGSKLVDGAYSTMIDRISSGNNPDLFIMEYSPDLQVKNLTLIPKFFFIPPIIEKRKPLSLSAKRAGWTGCNIILSDIPTQGKIKIVENQFIKDVKKTVAQYSQVKKLQDNQMESRGWILDVLNCINQIQSPDFCLQDVYAFAELLQLKHTNNNNIEAKIRQQLQILRDKGFIEFLGRGNYRKVIT